MEGGGGWRLVRREWREEVDECGLGSEWMEVDWDSVKGGSGWRRVREGVEGGDG